MPDQPTRREFLTGAAGAVALAVVGPVVGRVAPSSAATTPFMHGVASGDPLADRVVIWTRVTPTADATPGSGRGPAVAVDWAVARDPGFVDVIARGTVRADSSTDHTVQIDVTGLDPNADHWYRFSALGAISPTGRTRTTPRAEDAVERLRLGLITCAEYEFGYFGAYRLLAERDDIDAVLNLGDYVYEFGRSYGPLPSPGASLNRNHEPAHECLTLADYRVRYGSYRLDPDLQFLHARHPVISTFDDHEVANDTWRNGAENHSASEGDFGSRARAAHQAWREWLPMRRVDAADPEKIHRSFRFGTLVELWMLDERRYRDAPPASAIVGYGSIDPAVDDPTRSMLGAEQRDWLLAGLRTSPATWKVWGNPVSVVPIDVGPALAGAFDATLRGLPTPRPPLPPPLLIDGWDGYAYERQRIIDAVVASRIDNVVILTGDYHETFASHIPVNQATFDIDRRAAAVEFIIPAITSPGLSDTLALSGLPQAQTVNTVFEANLAASNPWVSYHEGFANGYAVAEFRSDAMQIDFVFIDDRRKPAPAARAGSSWKVATRTNVLARSASALPTRTRTTRAPVARATSPAVIPATGGEQAVALWVAALLTAAGAGVRLTRQQPGPGRSRIEGSTTSM